MYNYNEGQNIRVERAVQLLQGQMRKGNLIKFVKEIITGCYQCEADYEL
jgi:hypothetical protein